MHSKTSFFKAVLIRKTILRFWPAWALYLIVLLFAVLIPVYNIEPETRRLAAYNDAFTYLNNGCQPVLIFCFAILFALLVFSWLYSARSCNMMHAFPFKRSQLFLSHYIAGFGFLAVPQLLVYLAVIPRCLQYGILPDVIGRCFLFALACDFIFFSIAVLCCMLAGHLLSALVYCLIFNSVAVIVRILFKGIYANYGYGLVGSDVTAVGKGDFLSPIVFIASRCEVAFDRSSEDMVTAIRTVHVEGLLPLIGFCVMAVVVLAFAMYLYRIRQVECAGEMSAFRALNPIIRWIVAICCGLATGVFLAEILFDRGYTPGTFVQMVILTVIFSLIWYLITEMVLKKTFRIFRPGFWAEWGIMCAVILCLLGSVRADAFHVVRNVPDAGSVRAALVESNYSIAVTDPDEIEKVVRLQEAFLENKDRYQDYQEKYYEAGEENDNSLWVEQVRITYFLAGGKTMERAYYLPVTEEEIEDSAGALGVLTSLETPESALETMLGKESSSIQFTNAVLNGTEEMPKEAAQALFAAFKKDLKAGNVRYQTKDMILRKYHDGQWFEDSIALTLSGEAKGHYQNGIAGIFAEIEDQDHSNWSEDPDHFWGDFYYLYGGNNITHGEDVYFQSSDMTEITVDLWINTDCENICSVLEQYGVITDPSDIDRMLQDYLQEMYSETDGYGGVG